MHPKHWLISTQVALPAAALGPALGARRRAALGLAQGGELREGRGATARQRGRGRHGPASILPVRPGLARAPAVADRVRPRRPGDGRVGDARRVLPRRRRRRRGGTRQSIGPGQHGAVTTGGRPRRRRRRRRPAVLRRAPALPDPRRRRDSHGLVVGNVAGCERRRHVRGHGVPGARAPRAAAEARRARPGFVLRLGRAGRRRALPGRGLRDLRARPRRNLLAGSGDGVQVGSAPSLRHRRAAKFTDRSAVDATSRRRERRSTRAGARSRSAASTSSAASGAGGSATRGSCGATRGTRGTSRCGRAGAPSTSFWRTRPLSRAGRRASRRGATTGAGSWSRWCGPWRRTSAGAATRAS